MVFTAQNTTGRALIDNTEHSFLSTSSDTCVWCSVPICLADSAHNTTGRALIGDTEQSFVVFVIQLCVVFCADLFD